MKIWHISDTHGYHELLSEPEGVDVVVFSGDESNYRDPIRNEFEFMDFIKWFSSLKAFYKIMIAGNHSSFIFHNNKIARKIMNDSGIIYLDSDEICIDGTWFYGDPYTPTFNDWCFMSNRAKMDNRWSNIPDRANVLITHGPPYSILDYSFNRDRSIDICGDKSLLRHVRRVKPTLHLFGHIHDNEGIINHGIRKVEDITFSNGSVVKDNKFGVLCYNGSILEI